MKKLLILATLCPVIAGANPYVEFKKYHEKTDWSHYYEPLCTWDSCFGGFTERFVHSETHNTLRVGYEFETGLYLETGTNTIAAGFNKSFNNLDLSIDHERLDDSKNTTQTEVRVRYTFGN